MDFDDAPVSFGVKANNPSKYPMLWFPLHGDSVGNDTATTIVEQSGNTDTLPSGAITVTGTTAGIWANDGTFTGDGTVQALDVTEAMREFCDLSTITEGGILVCFNLQIASAPVTDEEIIIDASSTHGANGGWEIDLSTAKQLWLKVKPPGSGITNIASDTGALSVDTLYSYVVYIDVTYNCGVIMRDKVQQTARAELPTLPSGDVSKGVSIFSRFDGNKGVGLNSTMQLSNMQIYRVNEDIAGYIPTVSIQYKANPNEIPQILRTA